MIFHKEEDVRKAFELDWFQSQINAKYRYLNMKAGNRNYIHCIYKNHKLDKSDKEKYVMGLLQSYGEKETEQEQEKKTEFFEKMQEDGFTVVLNRQGTVNLRKSQKNQRNEEKSKKKSKFRSDFYKFQTKAQGFLL